MATKKNPGVKKYARKSKRAAKLGGKYYTSVVKQGGIDKPTSKATARKHTKFRKAESRARVAQLSSVKRTYKKRLRKPTSTKVSSSTGSSTRKKRTPAPKRTKKRYH